MKKAKIIYRILVGRSVRAVLLYRLSSWCYKNRLKLFSQIFWSLNVMLHSLEISPLAVIGKNFKISHTVGIVIGAGTVIGDNVTIYQNVTLGAKGEGSDKYPTLGNDVKIYPGAVVVGNILIGDNATVAPNAVVIHNVPSNYKAMGIPAKMYK